MLHLMTVAVCVSLHIFILLSQPDHGSRRHCPRWRCDRRQPDEAVQVLQRQRPCPPSLQLHLHLHHQCHPRGDTGLSQPNAFLLHGQRTFDSMFCHGKVVRNFEYGCGGRKFFIQCFCMTKHVDDFLFQGSLLVRLIQHRIQFLFYPNFNATNLVATSNRSLYRTIRSVHHAFGT